MRRRDRDPSARAVPRMDGLTARASALGATRIALLLGIGYGIAFQVVWIVDDVRVGAHPVSTVAAALVIVVLLAFLLPRRRRLWVIVPATVAVTALDIYAEVTGIDEALGAASLITLAILALYLGYLRSLRLIVPLVLYGIGYGLVSEYVTPGLGGFTLQGVLPVTVVLAAAGWAIGSLLRRRRAAELAVATLTEQRRRERVGLARELHDSVARDLTIIAMQSAVLRHSDRPEDQEYARAAIEETSRSGLDALKRLLVVLRAEEAVDAPQLVRDLETESLVDTVDAAARHLTMLGYQVTLSRVPPDLPRAAESTAVRVVREGTTNITKHSGPGSLCRIEVEVDRTDLVVRVENDLRAGPVTAVPSTGLGLGSLEERLRLLGGSLERGRRDGRWVLLARIPLAPPLAGSVHA